MKTTGGFRQKVKFISENIKRKFTGHRNNFFIEFRSFPGASTIPPDSSRYNFKAVRPPSCRYLEKT